jgi:DNA-binding CsgD family transcriptional regulator
VNTKRDTVTFSRLNKHIDLLAYNHLFEGTASAAVDRSLPRMEANLAITLRTKDIANLRSALEAILTPDLNGNPEDWGCTVMSEVKKLVGADQAFFSLPLNGAVHLVGDGERTAEAARQYESDYWRVDFLIGERRKALGRDVHQQNDLYLPGETTRDVLFNEWCVPNRLFDTMGVAVDLPGAPIPAGVNVYHRNKNQPAFGEKGRTLLELIAPAFRSTVSSYSALTRLRQSFHELVDRIHDGVCMIDADGRVVFQNSRLGEISRAERNQDELAAGLSTIAKEMARFASGTREADEVLAGTASKLICTRSRRYEIRVAYLSEVSSLPGVIGLIYVVPDATKPACDEATVRRIRARFGLTGREAEVAILLAARHTSLEIAARLGISAHTARHHTERVLAKTRVKRRGMVARALEE